MKLCKDCKHHIRRAEWTAFDRCNRKNLIDPDRINEMTSFCDLQREDGWLMARLEGSCGREARFFEPKEAKP